MALSCSDPCMQVAKAASSDSDDSSEEEDSEDEAPKDQVGAGQTSPSALSRQQESDRTGPRTMLNAHQTYFVCNFSRRT
jgi:hypothetical protein